MIVTSNPNRIPRVYEGNRVGTAAHDEKGLWNSFKRETRERAGVMDDDEGGERKRDELRTCKMR